MGQLSRIMKVACEARNSDRKIFDFPSNSQQTELQSGSTLHELRSCLFPRPIKAALLGK